MFPSSIRRIRARIGFITPEIGGDAIKKYSGIKSLKPILEKFKYFQHTINLSLKFLDIF